MKIHVTLSVYKRDDGTFLPHFTFTEIVGDESGQTMNFIQHNFSLSYSTKEEALSVARTTALNKAKKQFGENTQLVFDIEE